MIAVLVVNINNLAYTKDVINDLFVQDAPYTLTVVDQGSEEQGTKEYFDFLAELDSVTVIKNPCNVNLNLLWNELFWNSKEPYLCFLNNDVRIPRNFIRDTIDIFERESRVGAVVHATNHPKYCSVKELDYKILEEPITQGWDFTMRRRVYSPIPEDINTFGGDDWLFTRMYSLGWRTAVATSSPIIHYKAKSRQYFKGDRNEVIRRLQEYGVGRLSYNSPYTKQLPTFEKIIE